MDNNQESKIEEVGSNWTNQPKVSKRHYYIRTSLMTSQLHHFWCFLQLAAEKKTLKTVQL